MINGLPVVGGQKTRYYVTASYAGKLGARTIAEITSDLLRRQVSFIDKAIKKMFPPGLNPGLDKGDRHMLCWVISQYEALVDMTANSLGAQAMESEQLQVAEQISKLTAQIDNLAGIIRHSDEEYLMRYSFPAMELTYAEWKSGERVQYRRLFGNTSPQKGWTVFNDWLFAQCKAAKKVEQQPEALVPPYRAPQGYEWQLQLVPVAPPPYPHPLGSVPPVNPSVMYYAEPPGTQGGYPSQYPSAFPPASGVTWVQGNGYPSSGGYPGQSSPYGD